MAGGIILAVYVVGFFATPYVMGLIGEDDCLIAIPMFLWPAYALWALPSLIAKTLHALGERHGGHA